MPRTSLASCTFTSTYSPFNFIVRAAILLTVLVVCAAGLNAQTFIPINFPGGISTEAHGINAFGQIVGSWTDAGNKSHGFLYDAGVYTSIDYPGTVQGTDARSINNAGEIVGFHDLGVAFLLKNGVFSSFGGGFDINNFDFTASGSGFMDSSGQTHLINAPGSASTTTYGISDALEVVGDFWDGSHTHGFSFNQVSYSTIDFPGSNETICQGVNTLGDVVGFYVDASNVQHGFLFTGGAFSQVDYPGGTTLNYAFHVNDFDQVVGRAIQAGTFIGYLRSPAAVHPVPHINQAVAPDTSSPGGAGFTLTVLGTEFVSGAVVNWNGSPLSTSFQNSEKLTATVNASNVAAVGTALITVTNPTPGGGKSNAQFFSITNPTSGVNFSRTIVTAGTSPQRNVAADFNGDGIMDLAAADGPNNRVLVMLGKGDGTFQTAVPYQVGTTPSSLISADFDNDNKLDIAVADSDGGIYVLQGNGDGTFHVDPIISVAGSGPWDLAVGDFNGDGKLDLACVNQTSNTVSIFLGNGNATFNGEGFFQPPATIATNPGPSQIAVGDFNGDGILDLAVANFGGFMGDTVSVFIGKGNGTFQPKVDYSTNLAPLSVVTADFNGDGKLDLAVAASCGSSSPCGRPGVVSILLGNGDGTFQNHTDYPAGWFPYTVIAGDFNGDGKLDVAVTDLDSNQVTILSGAGDGTFQNLGALSTTASPVGLLAADFNRDGNMDFAVGTGSNINILLQYVPVQNIASVTLSPASVVGGGVATGTVTLSGVAPVGGAPIALSSSNPGVATVVSPVTVLAGNTSATFTVTSIPVAANTSVSITATYGSSTKSATLTVKAPTVKSFVLTPATLIGGKTSTAKATLTGPAPSSGLTITLSSNNPSIASPTGNISISGGATTGSATIATQVVATNTPVGITWALGTASKTATLTVEPAALLSIKLLPISLYGGSSSTATVTLNGAAPLSGASITLTSSDPSIATVQSPLNISSGNTFNTITVQTQPVSVTTSVTISAVYLGVTKTATLTVKAPVLSAITLSPASVKGGGQSTATIKLTSPAPAAGITIALASSNTGVARIQPSVTITSGTSVPVTISTSPVLFTTPVQIGATYAGVTKTATLTVH